ncbi:alpha/beta hydrolase [Enterococcus sp. LJL98]
MLKKDSDHYLQLHTHHLFVPYTKKERRVRVLLPKTYKENQAQRYPVLYMHDGQNVFYSREAYSGHSWKVIPHLKRNAQIPEIMIVAIDHDGEGRLMEYTPWEMSPTEVEKTQTIGGLGQWHAQWIVEEVMPFVNRTYRTQTEKDQTFLAGSSLGGLMTAYMGAAYPDVFGRLGIFSLASWVNDETFLDYVGSHPLHPETKVYLQVGTSEGNVADQSFTTRNVNQVYLNSSLWYYQTLLRTGHSLEKIWFRILADETHSEKYWATHFGEFLVYCSQ